MNINENRKVQFRYHLPVFQKSHAKILIPNYFVQYKYNFFWPSEDQRFEQHSIVFFPDEMTRYRMLCLTEVNGSEMLDVDLIQCYLVKVATKLVPKAITFLCWSTGWQCMIWYTVCFPTIYGQICSAEEFYSLKKGELFKRKSCCGILYNSHCGEVYDWLVRDSFKCNGILSEFHN